MAAISDFRNTLRILYSVVLMDLIGFGIMVPLLPYFAMSFGASSVALGIMTTSFSLAQMVGNIVLGAASDRFGRRCVLCVCLGGSAASYGAFWCVNTLEGLILLRALSGFFSGTIGCSQAYVTAIVSAKDRGKYLGYIGACIGAGFAFGPGIGAILSARFGYRAPCLFASVVCLVNCVIGALFLVEPPAREQAGSATEPFLSKSSPLKDERPQGCVTFFKEHGHCLLILCSTTLYYSAFAIFESMGAFYFFHELDMTTSEFGAMSTLSGVGCILVQRYLCKGLIRRLGEAYAGVAAHGCRLAAYLLVVVFPFKWAVYLMGPLISGGSILAPCSAALLAATVSSERRGAMLGLNQTFASFGRVVGPLLAGAVYQEGPTCIWYVAAVSSVLGALLLTKVGRHRAAASLEQPCSAAPIDEVAREKLPIQAPPSPQANRSTLTPRTLHQSAHPCRAVACASGQDSPDVEVGEAGESCRETRPLPPAPEFMFKPPPFPMSLAGKRCAADLIKGYLAEDALENGDLDGTSTASSEAGSSFPRSELV